MPLHKKKPFPLVEAPQNLDPSELVYQIRFTKEILLDYKEYLNRLNLYRRRVWTCKTTGKTNLTYEEALISEHHAAEKVQQFPKELMAPALEMIQYSTLTLKDLVDALYTKLQEHLFEGFELHGRKDQSVYTCKILKILQDGSDIQYEVGWLDKEKRVIETSIAKADDLICKKAPYSRSVLKAFIRESTSQSAPWVVHEELAKKHGISTKPPEDLVARSKPGRKADRKDDPDNKKTSNKKRKNTENGSIAGMGTTKKKAKREDELPKKEPIKYPIEDLLVQPAADDPVFSDRPSLSTDFKVPMDCIGDLLMIWDFCSSFARLLNLWRFSFENFENAICFKDSNLILIVESHAALLRLLIKDEGDYFMVIQGKKRKSKITLITWTEFLCDFLEMEGRAEFSKYLATIKRGHYGLLDVNVKLKIFRELVTEALNANAIRARLDECIEQQQELAAKRREEKKRIKEEQRLNSEISDKNRDDLQNGNGNACNSAINGMAAQSEDVACVEKKKAKVSKRKHMQENGVRKHQAVNSKELIVDNGNSSEKIKNVSATKECMKKQWRRKHKDKDAQEKQPQEEQKDNLEQELEKLSIRTSSLGVDRNYNRYWFFRREGRLFIESSDSKQWGYYTTKEELDVFMGSLNPNGVRERALQKQLEKHYHRISNALQKRSKEAAQKALLEDSELRRSTRVRAQPRTKPPFITYVNKWKDD